MNAPKSLLRAPLKPGERLVCYCPPGVCQAPKGFIGPCNRAEAPAALASQEASRPDPALGHPAAPGSEALCWAIRPMVSLAPAADKLCWVHFKVGVQQFTIGSEPMPEDEAAHFAGCFVLALAGAFRTLPAAAPSCHPAAPGSLSASPAPLSEPCATDPSARPARLPETPFGAPTLEDAYAEGRRDEQEELSSVLPGVTYMDPPDGGAPAILEQLQRQAKDAARYLWLREHAAYVGVNPHTRTTLWVLRGVFEVPGRGFDEAVDAARTAIDRATGAKP